MYCQKGSKVTVKRNLSCCMLQSYRLVYVPGYNFYIYNQTETLIFSVAISAI